MFDGDDLPVKARFGSITSSGIRIAWSALARVRLIAAHWDQRSRNETARMLPSLTEGLGSIIVVPLHTIGWPITPG
jgi:hypothetical protein